MQVNVSKAEVNAFNLEKINKRWQERWDRKEKGRHISKFRETLKRIGLEVGIGEKRQ